MGYVLTSADIDRASEEIQVYLQQKKAEPAEMIKVRLGVEETLLRYMEQFGEVPFTLKFRKVFSKIEISVSVRGAMFSPFSQSSDEESENKLMRKALVAAGGLPSWKYGFGTNTVTYSLMKKQMPLWAYMVASVAAAVLLWGVLALFPENVTVFVNEQIVSPLLSKFLGLVTGISAPLLFLMIVTGISGFGDAGLFGSLGKQLGLCILFCLLGILAVSTVLCLVFFDLKFGAGELGDDFQGILMVILDIIPGNLFVPFTEGNTLQILFMGIFAGIAMIFLSERVQTLSSAFEQLAEMFQVFLGWACKLLPIFIFGSIFSFLAGGAAKNIGSAGKIIGFSVGLLVVFGFFLSALVCIRTKTGLLVFLKKTMNAFLIGFTTCSSSASLDPSMKTCREEMGIDEKMVRFGVPFSQITFKSYPAIFYFFVAVSIAEQHEMTVSVVWLVLTIFLSFVLSIAVPPVPGGDVAVMTILFAQLGLPYEELGIALTIAALVDNISTAGNVFTCQCVIALCAKNCGLMDEEVMRR